jgi:O-acetyl-ADP-ribose deacetylase (regulator of RNase III)
MTAGMARKRCFVIMPFKKKSVGDVEVDFDEVYERLIQPAVEAEGLDCIRCDQIARPGSIHKSMIENIFEADVAVVDITTLNPNVFYELGVRHALKSRVTVLLRREQVDVPFNINGFNVTDYNLKKRAESVAKLRKCIGSGLESADTDSLVHTVLDSRIGASSKVIEETTVIEYQVAASARRLGIITGDIRQVEGIAIWVNSENTDMQMARFFDRSISGVVRYLGSKRNPQGEVTDDTIAKELESKTGGRRLRSAAVIRTGAGALSQNGVAAIYHAAAVNGEVGKGYAPVRDLANCVHEAFKLARGESPKLKSILFPLLGTGTASGDPKKIAPTLIKAALGCLREDSNPIERAYFMAYTEDELAVCQDVFRRLGLKKVHRRPAPRRTSAPAAAE